MTDLYFGLTQEKWHEASKEMRKILIARAKRNANMLGEISVDEHNAGKPLLSAVAILKADNIPGGGFYTLAESLGFTVSDKVEFWIKEFNRCHDYWSKV